MDDGRPAPKRVSVVIPNFNGEDVLPACLEALQAQSYSNFETIVVDNGSTDASLTLIETRFPWVRTLSLERNTGFTGACNAGIHASDSEFVVLLNSDTQADPGFLDALVSALDEFPQAGFAASKMLLEEPPHLIDSAGDWFSYKLGVPFNMGAGQPSSDRASREWVFGACAGAAIYRRKLFDDIGAFDEDFFLIYEDVDLDFRAQWAGYKCLYVPEAIVLHKRGVSIKQPSVEIRAGVLRNRIWTVGRNLPPRLLVICVVLGSIRTVRWLGWRVKRRLMGHRNYPPGYFGRGIYRREITRAFLKLPGKRRAARKTRRVPAKVIEELLATPGTPAD